MQNPEKKKNLLEKIRGRFIALTDWIAKGHKKQPLCKS
jgi:hypothetical protein